MAFPWLVVGALGSAAIAGAVGRLTRQYALAALAGGTAILYIHGWLYFHYTSDDAYISYRYARNLADGAGLVWNPGQHVEGYSNFSWVLTLAGLHKLGADIVLSGRWLGFALAAASGVLTYVLATRMLDGGASRAAGLVAALLLAASGTWAAWAPAGMEIPLFATLVLGAVILHIEEQRGDLIPLSGLIWSLVAITRPDGVVLVAVSGVFKLGESSVRWRRGGDASPGDDRLVDEVSRVAIWVAGFAVLFLPYFAWRYHEYGWLLPNTFYAKVGANSDQYQRGLNYLLTFSQEHAAWLLLVAPLSVALTSIRRAPALYVLALVVA